MPEDATYRKYTEQIIKERAAVLTKVKFLINFLNLKTTKNYLVTNLHSHLQLQT